MGGVIQQERTMSDPFFDSTFNVINAQRAALGLEPLEQCACGKPATYLGMCNACYHSAQISSREEHSAECREEAERQLREEIA